MFRLMKKDASVFAVSLALVILMIVVLRLVVSGRSVILLMISSGICVYLLLWGSLILSEQYEEKHSGYAQMALLPLYPIEIAASKFLLMLLADGILCGFLILLWNHSLPDPKQEALLRSFILVNGILALLLAAILYIGIIICGFTACAKLAVSISLLFFGVIPILLYRIYGDPIILLARRGAELLISLDWLPVLVFSLFAFVLLMLAAAKLRALRAA